MLFKIVLELLLEINYLPKQKKGVIRNIILLSKEIVQDPSVLFSICRLIDLKLSLIENRPTLLWWLMGETLQQSLLLLSWESGYYFNILKIVLNGNASLCRFKFWLCSETAGFEHWLLPMGYHVNKWVLQVWVFVGYILFDFLTRAKKRLN